MVLIVVLFKYFYYLNNQEEGKKINIFTNSTSNSPHPGHGKSASSVMVRDVGFVQEEIPAHPDQGDSCYK